MLRCRMLPKTPCGHEAIAAKLAYKWCLQRGRCLLCTTHISGRDLHKVRYLRGPKVFLPFKETQSTKTTQHNTLQYNAPEKKTKHDRNFVKSRTGDRCNFRCTCPPCPPVHIRTHSFANAAHTQQTSSSKVTAHTHINITAPHCMHWFQIGEVNRKVPVETQWHRQVYTPASSGSDRGAR